MELKKIIALIIHNLALLGGLGLFIATVYIMSYPSSIMTILETETVTAISAFVCGLSIAIIGVASIGLLGTWSESAQLLKIFVGLVIVALIIEISAIVTPFGMRRRWEDKFNDQIFAVMDKYGQDEYPFLTQMWDDFQTNWECCGSFKPEDWSFSAYVQQEYYPVLIPPSCCKSFVSQDGVRARCVRRNEPDLYYNKGCLTAAKDLIWSYMGIVGGLASAVFACQILVLIISFLLIREYGDYEEEPEHGEVKLAPPSSAVASFKPVALQDKRRSPIEGPVEGDGSNSSRAEIDL